MLRHARRGADLARRSGAVCATYCTRQQSTQAVAFLDPKYLFDHKARDKAILSRRSGDPDVVMEFNLSDAMVQAVKEARERLADFDEPGNSWVVGEQGEIFEYDFIGNVLTRSGFLAAVPKEAVLADALGRKRWSPFADMASRHSRVPESKLEAPMLLCGRVVGGDMMGVYSLVRNQSLAGLLFVSTFAEA